MFKMFKITKAHQKNNGEKSKWFKCVQLYVEYSAAVIPFPKIY